MISSVVVFPAPFGAKDTENLALGHGKGNLVNGCKGAESFDQTLYTDCFIHDNIVNYITNFVAPTAFEHDKHPSVRWPFG